MNTLLLSVSVTGIECILDVFHLLRTSYWSHQLFDWNVTKLCANTTSSLIIERVYFVFRRTMQRSRTLTESKANVSVRLILIHWSTHETLSSRFHSTSSDVCILLRKNTINEVRQGLIWEYDDAWCVQGHKTDDWSEGYVHICQIRTMIGFV